MLRDQWRSGIAHVGLALREPEDFAAAWHEGSASYAPWVWIALGLTAILGTTTYGMTMGILGGAGEIEEAEGVEELASNDGDQREIPGGRPAAAGLEPAHHATEDVEHRNTDAREHDQVDERDPEGN